MNDPRGPRGDHSSKRVIEMLDALLERPPGERAALLDRLCADDPDLCAELEPLLAAESDAYAWFDRLGDRIADSASAELADAEHESHEIGRWRTVRRIGQGGMGTVYLAERADGTFEQRVALKLIRRGMESETVIERLISEPRILARVEHPNVARLLDGDVTEDGLPFFVMEYVEGRALDRYCADTDPPLDRRLELFLAVGEAVRHLHQHLIVHRDLKPGNVLVDTACGHLENSL